MFFGSPYYDRADLAIQSQIQVLQADIIYVTKLKVTSPEGYQFFAKQKAIILIPRART